MSGMAVDRLSADDRLVLWTDAAWPQDVGLVAVLDGAQLLDRDGRFRLDEARDVLTGRLAAVPRLRQVLREPAWGLGGPFWADDASFDVREHVHEASVPSGNGTAEMPDLLRAVEQIRRRRLDVSRPLWEMWFLPGLPAGCVGVFMRMHHVVADGMAAVATLGSLLDPTPEGQVREVAPRASCPEPSTRQLAVDNLQRRLRGPARMLRTVARPGPALHGLRAAWPSTRELLGGAPGPRTSLDGLVGPDRTLAVARSSLADVSAVARCHGGTVNDVLLAMTAGGLCALLTSRGERAEGLNVPIFVPVSLRLNGRDEEMGNRISQIVVPLPLGIPDPVERLRSITAAMVQRKSVARPPLGALFRSRLLSKPLLKLIIRQRVNVESADLVGPPSPVRFAGADVLEMVPLLNLMGNVTLAVGALSYSGRFDLLVEGDAALYPDLDAFVAGATRELEALVSLSALA